MGTMSNSTPLPIQEAVRDLLRDLVGTGAAVDKTTPLVFDEEDNVRGVIAEYIDDDDVLMALCLADHPFVCYCGAALSMIPAAAAKESVRRNELPENLLDNYSEVVNIMARLLNSPTTAHLRLGRVHVVPGELPEEVSKAMAAPSMRRDFAATITGYGSGNVSLLLV